MVSFDSSKWFDFQAGKVKSYKFSDNNRDSSYASFKQYKQDALTTARGIIGLFDANYDNRQSLEEYFSERREYAKLDMNGWDTWENDNIRKFNEEKYTKIFQKLDVDGDGFLSDKEIANELTLLDSYKSCGNGSDGKIGFTCDADLRVFSADKIKQNYEEMGF